MSLATDIQEARGFLEKAAAVSEPTAKLSAFEEALDLLDACETDNPSTEESRLIANLRFSHTRMLLGQLASLGALPFGTWFRFINLLFSRLNNEVTKVIDEQPALNEQYRSFVRLWRTELLDLLQQEDA